jgi:hypothetical protein
MEMSKLLIKFLKETILKNFNLQFVQVQNIVMLEMKFKNMQQQMVVQLYVLIVDMAFISILIKIILFI